MIPDRIRRESQPLDNVRLHRSATASNAPAIFVWNAYSRSTASSLMGFGLLT